MKTNNSDRLVWDCLASSVRSEATVDVVDVKQLQLSMKKTIHLIGTVLRVLCLQSESYVGNVILDTVLLVQLGFPPHLTAARPRPFIGLQVLYRIVKKTFLLSFKNHSQNVLLPTPNLTWAQYISQPLPKPGSNVFTLLCREIREWRAQCFLGLPPFLREFIVLIWGRVRRCHFLHVSRSNGHLFAFMQV